MLTTLLYVEINVVGVIILLLLLFSRGAHIKSLEQRMFNWLVFTGILVLIFDTGTWVFNGAQFRGAYYLNYAFNIFYFLMNPIVSMLILFYTDAKIFDDKAGLSRRIPIYVLPCAVDVIILVLNEVFHNLFTIDRATNLYARGPMLVPFSLISFFYMAFAMALAFFQAVRLPKSLKREECIRMGLAALPPFIAAIIQTAFYGLSLIWIAAVISLLILYINIQNERSYTDYLTKLSNRMGFSASLDTQIHSAQKGKLFLIMCDIDNFKAINDTYGHAEGDYVLTHIADIILECIGSGDTAARYGGDEYTILCRRETKADVYDLVDKIQLLIGRRNDVGDKPYAVSVSLGIAEYDGSSIDTLLSQADADMYENKERNKNFITSVR